MRPPEPTSSDLIDRSGVDRIYPPPALMSRSFPFIAVAFLAAVSAPGTAGCVDSRSERPESASSRPAAGPPAFTDVTERAGLGGFRHDNGGFGLKWFPEQMGAGGAFIDYDGDGRLDVLLVGGGVWPDRSDRDVPALWMYRNEGDGTFSLVTEEVGLAGVRAYSLGLAVADYDNDGDQDFYLTTLGRNMLFRNDAGTFTEVGGPAGVADQEVWSSSAIFFDADRDGWLDLYVGGYADWSPETDVRCERGGEKVYCRPAHYYGIGSVYYRNNGDGTFANRTAEAGFTHDRGKSLGVAEMDYNEDGWPDLVVVNDGEGDLLYENDGDGTFTEKGVMSGIAYDDNGAARAGMGVDAGVVDATGEVTIFVGNFSDEMVGVYRHLEDGLFVDRAAASGIGYSTLSTLTFGLFLFDVELDGDLDLFLANGHVYPEASRLREGVGYRQRAQLFLGRGDGRFDEVEAAGAFQHKMVARGAAYADFDRDGDLDILITENDGPAHLWRNELFGGAAQHEAALRAERGRGPPPDARSDVLAGGSREEKAPAFLRVRVEGRESNRDGCGTRIEGFVGTQRMVRHIRGGSTYLSQSERAATFGLGAARQVDSLIVTWPSGRVDAFEGIPANHDIRVVEGSGTFSTERKSAL